MNLKLILGVSFLFFFSNSKDSSPNKVKNLVEKYIRKKVKNPDSYKAIFFSSIDTTHPEIYKDSLLKDFKPNYKYSIDHIYEIENSDKEKIKMTVTFYLDSSLTITESSPQSLNGDYGQLSGNVYWKYNNFIGNKPDAGSKITMYSLDTLRKEVFYETTCDVTGNFKLEKVLPGEYLLVVNSKNTTNSPAEHLDELRTYSYEISELFDYNIYKENESELNEYNTLDSIYNATQYRYYSKTSDYLKSYEQNKKLENQKMNMAEKIIEKIPLNIRSKIGLYSSYSNKIDLSNITIDENKTTNKIIDFGITYF